MGRAGGRGLDVLKVPATTAESLHDAASARGEAMYEDPATGLWVMTRAGLLARGTCCGQGCRHCPYVGTDRENPLRAGHVRDPSA